MTPSEAEAIAEAVVINVECADCGHYVMEGLSLQFPEHGEIFWKLFNEAFSPPKPRPAP